MMENDIKLGAEVDNNQERDNKKLELKIDGISCQACVAKIERKLSKTNGVFRPEGAGAAAQGRYSHRSSKGTIAANEKEKDVYPYHDSIGLARRRGLLYMPSCAFCKTYG